MSPSAQKRPAPTELDKVRFWKVKEGKAALDKPKQRSTQPITSTEGDPFHVLAASLKETAPNVLWLRYADDEASQPNPSPPLPDTEDLLSKSAQSLCDEHFEGIRPLSLEEIERIRTTTIGQTENDNWFKERVGKITASKFKKAVSCRKPEGLVRDILYPEKPKQCSDLHPSDPRRYGLETEPVAVEAYRHWCRLLDKDTVVTSTGLHIHERFPFLGASPDGLVREAGEDGLLEVKCPKSKAGMTPREACADKKFCSLFVNGEATLKTDHAYYYQVQGQLAVTGCQWCDFVIYTNNKTLAKSLAVERIYFDPNFWQTLILPGLLYFYKRAVIPEVLTKRIQRMNMLYTCGPGYLPFKRHVKGHYECTLDEKSLKVTIRKL
ncbi:hypothetical protein HPB47_010302 [Ixodes persulcatus]|uniref:Uncharacterized protein n=1 Tax=Ixodes persulcatus TaxID=34615 RepID=A0AC60NZF2_IXOPE|nr:hypothetical protein HPB47_010302 [Ixodes persulcatus]